MAAVSEASFSDSRNTNGDRSARGRIGIVFFAVALALVAIICLTIGAADASLTNAVSYGLSWTGSDMTSGPRDLLIVKDIRLPRIIIGVLVGASLAVSGTALQGLFRNPLADPGVIGVSAGASLGAVTVIVLGRTVFSGYYSVAGSYALPVAAFVGALGVTFLLYAISTRQGRTSVTTMILAGIALGALAFSLTGLLIFVADEAQLRELTFWQLGSLAGSSWQKIVVAGPIMLAALILLPRYARGLNAIMLGEAVAKHVGVPIQQLKYAIIILVAASTGAAVSISGGIAFVGIVVPHLLRMAIGPDNKYLLIASGLLGAIVLLLADAIARTIVAPAEMPIGIITAMLGAPVFLWMLLRQRGLLDL